MHEYRYIPFPEEPPALLAEVLAILLTHFGPHKTTDVWRGLSAHTELPYSTQPMRCGCSGRDATSKAQDRTEKGHTQRTCITAGKGAASPQCLTPYLRSLCYNHDEAHSTRKKQKERPHGRYSTRPC
jgi:hypothetical protein